MPTEDKQSIEVAVRFFDTDAVELQGWSCQAEAGSVVACTLKAAAIRVPEAPQGVSVALAVVLLACLARQRSKRLRRSLGLA